MALTIGHIVRDDDASGYNVKTGADASGRRIQFMALADEDGDQIGTNDVPLPIAATVATAASWYVTAGSRETQAEVKGSAGSVIEMSVINSSSSTLYAMLFDDTGTAANSDVPIVRQEVPATGQSVRVFGSEDPRDFSTGIIVALSTTDDTLTLPGAHYGTFEVKYL